MKFLSKIQIQPRNIKHGYVSLCRKSCENHIFQRGMAFSSTLKSTSSLVDMAPKNPSNITNVKNPWIEQKDPNGSSLTYYWNTETNETTHLGSPKPRNWIEVKDPNGSELTYWWDPEAHETTKLGESKPSYLSNTTTGGRAVQTPIFMNDNRPQTLGSAMKSMFWWGVGMSFAIAAVNAVLH